MSCQLCIGPFVKKSQMMVRLGMQQQKVAGKMLAEGRMQQASLSPIHSRSNGPTSGTGIRSNGDQVFAPAIAARSF
jgi:hypothetical protein